MARKPTDTVQLKLRFPEALRRQLERAGKANDCSMNAEIISRLERSFHNDPVVDMVALVMWLESAAGADGGHVPPQKKWKHDPASAAIVRAAVDRVIAAVAGLPLIPPASRGSAEALASTVLRKYGLSLPKK